MSHRNGVCSSCGAQYKVPADFASDKAKCKECGGVVEIGAIVEDPPPPPVPAKPVRKAAPKIEEHIPSGKKKGEPTMMEKLKAERRAQSAKVKAAPQKKASSAKPAAAKPAAAKPAAAKAAAPKARAAKASKADGDEKKPSTRGASRRGGKGGSRRSGARGSSRRRGEEVDEEEGAENTGRRGRAKKKSPVPLIATLGLLIIGGGAAAYFMSSGGEEGGENTEVAVNDQDVETPAEEPTATTPAEEPTKEAEATPAEEPVKEDSAEEDAAPEEVKAKPVSKRKDKDPTEIDLGALSDFPATAGCSADQWSSLQEDAALMIDPLAGAAGGRAEKRLKKAGFSAVPAIINTMKTLDFGTEQGQKDGDLMQRALEKIHNGKNFGWKYSTEPNDHWFNKRVVELWHKTWEKYRGDEAGWLKFTGLDKEGQAPSGGSDDEGGLSTDELDALDDI